MKHWDCFVIQLYQLLFYKLYLFCDIFSTYTELHEMTLKLSFFHTVLEYSAWLYTCTTLVHVCAYYTSLYDDIMYSIAWMN